MRDPIARVLLWVLQLLLRARANRRTTAPTSLLSSPSGSPSQPHPEGQRRTPTLPAPTPRNRKAPRRYRIADTGPVVRRYYAAYLAAPPEARATARLVRQRRREAYWASLGVDLPGVRVRGGAELEELLALRDAGAAA